MAEEIPDNVDFHWIARHLVALRERVDHLDDQLVVLTGMAMRHEGALGGLAVEVRGLVNMVARHERRIQMLEQ